MKQKRTPKFESRNLLKKNSETAQIPVIACIAILEKFASKDSIGRKYITWFRFRFNRNSVTTPDSHPSDRERASLTHVRDLAALTDESELRHLSRQNAPDSPT